MLDLPFLLDFAAQFIKSITSGEIDIEKTNIPFFASQLLFNFNFLFKEPLGETESEFYKELCDTINKNQVSYEYWFFFNFRLSILRTPKEYRSSWAGSFKHGVIDNLLHDDQWKSHSKTKEILYTPSSTMYDNSFKYCLSQKDYLIFPTVFSNFSIQDMNQTVGSNLFLVGLSGDKLYADGRAMYPDQFFAHDLVHLSNEFQGRDGMCLSVLTKIATRFHTYKKNIISRQNTKSTTKSTTRSTTNYLKLLDFLFFYATHEKCVYYSLENIYMGRPDSYIDSIFEFLLKNPQYVLRKDWYIIPEILHYNVEYFKDILTKALSPTPNLDLPLPLPLLLSSIPKNNLNVTSLNFTVHANYDNEIEYTNQVTLNDILNYNLLISNC